MSQLQQSKIIQNVLVVYIVRVQKLLEEVNYNIIRMFESNCF